MGGFSSQSVDLEFWGVYDEPRIFLRSIEDFNKLNPNVKINYRKIPFDDYEDILINALASGRGPDIFMIHNTWVPRFIDKLRPLPQKDKNLNYNLINFKQDFVDVTFRDLVFNDQIYGLPLYVDTLALYYNKDIFNAKEISLPPKTWNEFNETVARITEFDENGEIIKSGAAIGTARNINRSVDLLALLMIQSGVQMTDSGGAAFAKFVDGKPLGEIALQYYTDFSNPKKKVYTWNDSQFYSIDAFYSERTAMMFNYSHHIQTIKQKAPRLNFDIAPIPQIDPKNPVNYASYFAPVVSLASSNYIQAWRFLIYLSSRDGITPYLNASLRPTARRDLIDLQKSDPNLNVFVSQVLTAVSWYQVNNKAIEKIFADMIDDVNFGRTSIREALENAQNKINNLIHR